MGRSRMSWQMGGVVAALAVILVAPSAATAAPAVAATSSSALPAAYQGFLDSVGGSRFVQVGDVRMHYVEAGPKDAPVLLLVHGSPDNVYSWRNVMPTLARSYRVVAPDLAGFGLSGAPAGRLGWASEIHYLTGFVDALKLRKLTLVTTDIGGLFGFAYAAAHPDNVAGVAVWETVTAPIPGYDLLGAYCPACVGFFQVPKDPALRRQFITDNPDFAAQIYGGAGLLHPLAGDELAGYSYFLSTPAQRDRVADIGADMPIAGVPASTFVIASRFARWLRTSTVPKLLIYATPGSILPAATAAGLGWPNTTYTPVGPGNHYLVEDEPAALTAAVLAWRQTLPTHPGR
jgi:haloalkane dehalogenase